VTLPFFLISGRIMPLLLELWIMGSRGELKVSEFLGAGEKLRLGRDIFFRLKLKMS
jgi:hypothetical protein